MMLYGSEVTLTFVTDGSGSGAGFLLGYNLTSIPRQGSTLKNRLLDKFNLSGFDIEFTLG